MSERAAETFLLAIRKNSVLSWFKRSVFWIIHSLMTSIQEDSLASTRSQSPSRQLKNLEAYRAKSKIGHHCDGRNFFFQLSFLSSQMPRHFMYIIWINNHCTPQKHQWGAAMIKHVTVATHLKVRRTEFCSNIPSISKIHFRLSCFSSCVNLHREYTTQ